MPFNTGELARQFMIEAIECGTHLPEHADAFGSVLAKLGQPVISAAREPTWNWLSPALVGPVIRP
jgi:hypothetical protein